MILSVPASDGKSYLENPERVRDQVVWCPVCRARGIAVRLARNGWYPRSIPLRPGDRRGGKIFRKFCSRCRVSFSLLPEFLLRRQRYRLALVAAWLWAWLCGASSRCRDFYRIQGIRFAEASRMAWSDWLDQPDQRTRPGYQLLHRWVDVFTHRARQQMSELVAAAYEVGARLEEPSSPFRANPLGLAWLHWEALVRAGSAGSGTNDRRAAFEQLIRYLAREPSHLARRVSGGVFAYDVLVVNEGGLEPP